jgi:hypothetical protein
VSACAIYCELHGVVLCSKQRSALMKISTTIPLRMLGKLIFGKVFSILLISLLKLTKSFKPSRHEVTVHGDERACLY